MRHFYVLIAILGVCLTAAGQAAKQQPKPKPPASATTAQSQTPSDEEIMNKIEKATIEWDSKGIPGAKAEVRLVKKDQVDGKPEMQYRLKVSGLPNNKLYKLMAWPITIVLPVTMMEGLVIARDGTVGCPPDSTKSCGQFMKGAELTLKYTPGIGEIFRHALVSEDRKSSVFFSIVPAPMIEHDKACTLEIVRLSPRFQLALIRGKGFTPGDQISFHTESYQEIHDIQAKVNSEGEVWATLTPFVKGRTMGTTKVTTKSKACSPALAFEWGSE
jgi:hypothetical protein